ncbi:MAG: 4'-phosphopantetheinyl transferase superfamily protein [Methylococcaceae bacterium]|nr:4'-phosphopantetheinyl transferase superfamily protein [Methylococcaceae bacterium]
MMQQVDIFEINFLQKQSSEPLLRKMLAKHLQIPAEEFVIERGEFGKPYLRDFPEWQFNLSHSGEKMLLAISHNASVGIDIERIKSRHSISNLVKKCFSTLEQNYWFNLPEESKLTTFYDFWTRKEAVVKGIGRGIALGLNQCEIDTNQPNKFLNLPVNQTWHTHSVQISPNYCAAIATPCYVVKIKTHSNFIFT